MPEKTISKLKLTIGWVAGMMGVFTLTRLAIYLTYRKLFADLSLGEIGACFWHGIAFDFYMVALCIGPVLFLLNLPIVSKKWIKLCATILLLESIFIIGFLVGDFVYFPKVGRHIGEEIIQVSSDWKYIVSYMFTQLWWALFLLIGGCGFLLHTVFGAINRARVIPYSWVKTICILVCVLALTALGLRGHLGRGKALGVADVYKYVQSAPAAALTLNGAFTAYQVGRKGSQEFTNPFPLEQALLHTQALFLAPDETVPDPAYPLMRESQTLPAATDKKPNILIVLLEGWHPYYIDELSHQGFGVTPVFDQIVKDGVNFTNAYATGQRSIFGFAAILAGIPLVPGLPLLGYGLEMSSLSPMPAHFAQNGYYTFFVQTSHRDSYRMCALASYLGMQESFGWEDIPQLLPYRQKAPFGYDHDAFQFAADRIAQHPDKPFLGMVFTGITHEPFTSTLPEFDKYPYDTWEHGFLNTLGFADWSIGQLLKRAQKDGWFENTIFIFVADHISGGPAENTLKNHFRIPLVIYAPHYFTPQQNHKVVSQLDLGPTLYALAGLTPRYSVLGRNVWDEKSPQTALVCEGNNIGLMTPKGAVLHSGNKLLSVEAYSEDFEAQKAEDTLLSLDKTAYTLLKENRWYKPQTGGN